MRANGRHKEADDYEDYLAGPEGEEEPPEDGQFVWRLFLELTRRRAVGSGMGGVVLAPITLEAIAAWERGNGVELTPWERHAVVAVDDIYLDAQRRQAAAAAQQRR